MITRRELLLAAAATAAGCAFRGFDPIFDEEIPSGTETSVSIASLEEALTFARAKGPLGLVTVGVTSYAAGVVEGVDLGAVLGRAANEDAIALFRAVGRDAIAQAIRSGARRVFRQVDLGLPVDLRAHHVAAGTNYPAHAAATGVKDGPFLFPKLVVPTAWSADVALGQRLVDHEVELAFVALDDIQPEQRPEVMGLLLINDFTDRDVLLHAIDVDDVASGKGFTTAKSIPTFLPIGDLFVIPRDVRAFARDVELSLYVNRRLRQRDVFHRAVWDLDELLRQSWLRKGTTWAHAGRDVGLFEDGQSMAARSMILSGTPDGTVFREIELEQKASGFFDLLLGGWSKSVEDQAIDDYVHEARAAGIYLQPDDEVLIHVPRLGVLSNTTVRTS